jgi:hypothetical protein
MESSQALEAGCKRTNNPNDNRKYPAVKPQLIFDYYSTKTSKIYEKVTSCSYAQEYLFCHKDNFREIMMINISI